MADNVWGEFPVTISREWSDETREHQEITKSRDSFRVEWGIQALDSDPSGAQMFLDMNKVVTTWRDHVITRYNNLVSRGVGLHLGPLIVDTARIDITFHATLVLKGRVVLPAGSAIEAEEIIEAFVEATKFKGRFKIASDLETLAKEAL